MGTPLVGPRKCLNNGLESLGHLRGGNVTCFYHVKTMKKKVNSTIS